MLMPSITDARAYGLGLDATSFSPSKICTLVTSRMSNIRGVPSSVKLQMKTMVHPANSPGRSSGSQIRRNRAQRPAEQLWAASSRAGSILASPPWRSKHDRVQVEGFHQNHGRPSAIRQQIKRLVEDAPILKQNAEAAGSAKNMAKSDGAHKGGRINGTNRRGDNRPCPGYLVEPPKRPKEVRSPSTAQ